MKRKLIDYIRAAADLLLPRTCVVCGRKLLVDEQHMCLPCTAGLPRTFYWSMSRNPMADRFNDIIRKTVDESREREPYAYAASLFFFNDDNSYREIPYQIKYRGNTAAGRYFGNMLGGYLGSSDMFRDVDLIIPVPLHWSRLRKRGYNQAEVIAGAVADKLSAPVRADILKRIRKTRTQTKLDIEGKVSNVSGAFRATGYSPGNRPRHILLIDDIFTTGSTLHACFVALRAVFPPSVRISVATLGFVGD